MPAVSATAKNLSASAKRLRPMANAIRGKGVDEALHILQFLPSPWAKRMAKVVESAAANAENNLLMDRNGLKLVKVTVDEAARLKRFIPMGRGRGGRIRKRFSHVTVVVDQQEG